MIKEKHVKESEKYSELSPAYFAANDLCEQALKDWKDQDLNKIAEVASEAVSDQIYEKLQNLIWGGQLECGLQSMAYEMVDDTVNALLTGEEWALKRYVLNDSYGKGEKVREAVAKHIPEEIQDKRISDLQERILELTKQRDELRHQY